MAEFKHLVRIVNTDIDGNKKALLGLTAIKGVGFSMANYILVTLKIPKDQKIGDMDDKVIAKITEMLEKPEEAGIPDWMLNRRKDRETGKPMHLLSADIDFTKENDIKRLKMIKVYRGYRHMSKLPSRGQRTKSNFRHNKGNVLGVKRRAGAKKGK